MTIRPDLLKGALVSYLKSKSTITDLLDSAADIKEEQWQGRDFSYPAVRVHISSWQPGPTDCSFAEFDASVTCFSEQASSAECDKLSGIISNVLHEGAFSQTVESQNLKIIIWISVLIPAVRRDSRTWISQILLKGRISG